MTETFKTGILLEKVRKGSERIWSKIPSRQVGEQMMFGTTWFQIDDDGDFQKQIDIF